MELLESNDMKSELIKKSAKHRAQLEEEVKLISERTSKVVINTLVIGGALAVSYLLVRQLAGGGKSKSRRRKVVHAKPVRVIQSNGHEPVEEVSYEPAVPGIVTQIGTALASQATVFLLGLAKEKLAEYLHSSAEDKKETKE
ncbi:hypothetical protein [Parachryseolinea silvisoli]|jgi:hypothetical protein|uniref:hypothetical protein n=1 Tax=Parachryseolinea silvisoli TaxID=2873601 RepID=UPI002265AF59|nr:hypothetical protein [Parachryseolinea silvisoli]MCD9016093.1 hypothetical protein [Parachryseolinea silvisoli]